MSQLYKTSRRRQTAQRIAKGVGTTAVLTLVAAINTAYAQEAAKQDTVVVTGIRKGIEDAISVKKNSDNIVEAISAEDIGKLPDATVAESISRLPGVTSQRNAVTGRASSISVRGMSPDFNAGLLNGREQASSGDNRGVEFDMYPAELLGSAVIYKTPDAGLVGQGLSSTIDLRTVRPLDFAKRTIAIGARGQRSGINATEEGNTGSGSRLALSYVDQFADRTLGVALGLTRLKEEGAPITKYNTWGGWMPNLKDFGGINAIAPGGFGSDTETTESTRNGLMASLQYRPNKNFETSLDIFASTGKFITRKRGIEGPVGLPSTGGNDAGGTLSNYTLGTLPDGTQYVQSGTWTGWKGVIRNHDESYDERLNSYGWNMKYKGDTWTLISDLSQSRVLRDTIRYETTLGLPGSALVPGDTITMTGFDGRNPQSAHYTLGLNYADPSIIRLTNVQGWGGGKQDGYYANPKVIDNVNALRLSAKRDLSYGVFADLELGMNVTDRSKDKKTYEGVLLLKGGATAIPVPNPSTATAGSTGIPITTWNPQGSLGTIYELAPWYDVDILAKNWKVNEQVSTAYMRTGLDGSLFGQNIRGNAGLQFVGTNQYSNGYSVDKCDSGNHTCNIKAVTDGTTYQDVLPSMNLSMDAWAGSVVRLGVARVMARPNMIDMKSGLDFGPDKMGYFKGTGGNPKLQPFRANAIDISVEKYIDNKAYFSIAGFYKDLSTYILKVGTPYDFAPNITPLTTPPIDPNTGLPTTSTKGILTRPINGSGGTISGVEFTASFPFGILFKPLDGFGLSVNHSNTSSSLSLPASGFSTNGFAADDKMPLPGLSKRVTNLRFYFEKYGFQASVAQRTRSDFLGEITDYQDNRQLTFVEGEAIVDAQLGYEFQSGPLKGLSVLLQGTNLTNAVFQRYKVEKGEKVLADKTTYGKTYLFGINYKF